MKACKPTDKHTLRWGWGKTLLLDQHGVITYKPKSKAPAVPILQQFRKLGVQNVDTIMDLICLGDENEIFNFQSVSTQRRHLLGYGIILLYHQR